MPIGWIPALLRELTGGRDAVTVPGETIQQVIEQLETCFPGAGARLCQDGRLRSTVAVVVDGIVSTEQLRQAVTEMSEIHFVLAISGG